MHVVVRNSSLKLSVTIVFYCLKLVHTVVV